MMSFERLTPPIGAETIEQIDPSMIGDEGFADQIHAALMEHQVIVLRNVAITPHQLAGLARSLGPLPAPHHSYATHPDTGDVVVLTWEGDDKPDAAQWHSDMTYRQQPPFASLLHAVEVPPVGGDTLWASMYSAYDTLSPGLRSDLSELQAVHDLGDFRSSSYLTGGIEALNDAVARTGAAVHPIVAHHPHSGRPYLNVSESLTRWVIGMSGPESGRLLTLLFDHINRPDHSVRLRWRPGTLAIWDNRATQHYAVADYLPHRRVMHRVAVASDRRCP